MNDFVEVQYIFRIIRRRWGLLVVATLLAILAGYTYSVRQTAIYRATTNLTVGPTVYSANLDRDDFQISQQLARTYADLARRQVILQAVISELELEKSWQSLRNQIDIAAGDESQLLEIRVEAISPEQAVAIADEIARQLILLTPSSFQPGGDVGTEDFIHRRLEQLRINIETGQNRIDSLESRVSNVIGTSIDQAQQLQDEIETLVDLVATWESTYANLYRAFREDPTANYVTLIETAQASSSPIRPRTKLNLLVSAVIGFVLGLGSIFLVETVDHTLRSEDEVTDKLRLASLGKISRVFSEQPEDLLVTNQDIFSSMAEDCRMLRSKLLFLSKDWTRRVFLITSPAQGEGKSLVVANLGIAMANVGLKTVIVDANLRNPMQHVLFNLSQADGLTEEIQPSDSASPSSWLLLKRLKQSNIENLSVLTSGSLSLASPDRLGTSAMTAMLDELAERYDIILCDAPEAVTFADTLMLVNQTNGVLLVVEAGHTQRDIALQAVQNLQQAGAVLLGFVLNRAVTGRRPFTVFRRQPSPTAEPVADEPAHA